MAVILGAVIIRKCNINTIRSIFLWIRVRLVKSISKRINLKSLKKFYARRRPILWGGAGLLEVYTYQYNSSSSKWVQPQSFPRTRKNSIFLGLNKYRHFWGYPFRQLFCENYTNKKNENFNLIFDFWEDVPTCSTGTQYT